MPIPLLDLSGAPRERGRAHGEALRGDIAHNIDVYLTRFGKLGHSSESVLAGANRWMPHLERLDPAFAEELRGVADGAGRPLPEIAMLNVRYELIIAMFKAAGSQKLVGAVDGCTSFAVMPERTKTGETWIGQTWDWIPGVRTAVSRVTRDDGPDFICHGETGTVGGMQGVNEHGVGVVINALMSEEDDGQSYLAPFRLRVRNVLNAKHMHGAVLAISSTHRTASMNFVIGHADGEAIDIEASPTREAYIQPKDGIMTHSNHFCELDARSEVMRVWPNTVYRNTRLERMMLQSQKLEAKTMKTLISDHFAHPHSICAHVDPDEPETMQLETRNAILINLNTRTMMITDGPPCSNPLEEFRLNH
jgi:isopenicillin-N N-acyltransferase like protein